MKAIWIKMGYENGLVIPLEMVNELYQFQRVKSIGYSDTKLGWSDEPLDIRIIDLDSIKAVDDNPEAQKLKRDAMKAALIKELEKIAAEEANDTKV
jgi:hypothetical protein